MSLVEHLSNEKGDELFRNLISDTTRNFLAKQTYFDESIGRDVPYYLIEAAIDAIRGNEEYQPEDLVVLIMKKAKSKPIDLEDMEGFEGYATWDSFLISLGSEILYREIIANDSDIATEDSRRGLSDTGLL